MSSDSKQILEAALALPESDRADIAARLIRSLDAGKDEDAEAAWAAEIQRRIQSVDNGSAKLITWDDVLTEMRGRRDG